ncbi:MAG: hypothetical protein ACR2GH_09235 [Pseudonocardia sp.]
MAVSEETRHQLSRWCTERVPDADREQRQIGYTIHDDEVTILDRRRPAYPELGAAWSSTPVALLRCDDPEPGWWSLYRPAGDGWNREAAGEDPFALLDQVRH